MRRLRIDHAIAATRGVSLGMVAPSQRLVDDLGFTGTDLGRLAAALGLVGEQIDWLIEKWETVADVYRSFDA